MNKTALIAVLFAAIAPACSNLALSPSHKAKYVFSGKVTTTQGNPVQGALVKVLGWESLTDAKGEWKQEHVVHCGALRDAMSASDVSDTILVLADGYESEELNFVVKHPAWFSSCEKPEEDLRFNTTLAALGTKAKGKTTAEKAPSPETPKSQEPKHSISIGNGSGGITL